MTYLAERFMQLSEVLLVKPEKGQFWKARMEMPCIYVVWPQYSCSILHVYETTKS